MLECGCSEAVVKDERGARYTGETLGTREYIGDTLGKDFEAGVTFGEALGARYTGDILGVRPEA